MDDLKKEVPIVSKTLLVQFVRSVSLSLWSYQTFPSPPSVNVKL